MSKTEQLPPVPVSLETSLIRWLLTAPSPKTLHEYLELDLKYSYARACVARIALHYKKYISHNELKLPEGETPQSVAETLVANDVLARTLENGTDKQFTLLHATLAWLQKQLECPKGFTCFDKRVEPAAQPTAQPTAQPAAQPTAQPAA